MHQMTEPVRPVSSTEIGTSIQSHIKPKIRVLADVRSLELILPSSMPLSPLEDDEGAAPGEGFVREILDMVNYFRASTFEDMRTLQEYLLRMTHDSHHAAYMLRDNAYVQANIKSKNFLIGGLACIFNPRLV